MAMNLARQFAQLSSPSGEGSDLQFVAAPVEEHRAHRIAVDRHGLPALLIGVSDAGYAGPPLVLEHIRMQQGVECRVTDPDGTTETHRLTIIRCTDDNPSTREYFLRIGGTVLEALGDAPTTGAVTRTLERLIDLFRALSAPPRKSVIGFWAELFVIACSREPSTLVHAWHQIPEERFDFALGNQRLEVKAAAGRVRKHHFSLEQLHPPGGVTLLVSSLLLERSNAGPSLAELIEHVRAAVASEPTEVLRVDAVVALTLGSDWRHAMGERFDEHLAASTLLFFEPSSIPKPEGTLPRGVTEVRFVSDLSNVSAVSPDAYVVGKDLLSAAVKRRGLKTLRNDNRER